MWQRRESACRWSETDLSERNGETEERQTRLSLAAVPKRWDELEANRNREPRKVRKHTRGLIQPSHWRRDACTNGMSQRHLRAKDLKRKGRKPTFGVAC